MSEHIFERAPSYGCYVSGCRCEDCRDCKRTYNRNWQRAYRARADVRAKKQAKDREASKTRVRTPEQLEAKRAKDRARYHAKKNGGV